MPSSHSPFGERPFMPAPLARRYFPTAPMEAALKTLSRAVERAEGIGALVGPAGVGKTLLLKLLARQLGDRFHVALVSAAQIVTRRALCQSLLRELGEEHRGLDDGELRMAVSDALAAAAGATEGMALLVDDAHMLSWRVMEALRELTDVAQDGQPRVRLVVAGSRRLEERFADSRMEHFAQRVAARCYLEPMSRDETDAYIQGQMKTVGADPGIFTSDGRRAVQQITDGVARLVNQLCDHALLLAGVARREAIGASQIEAAWADLQQLPSPAVKSEERATVSVVEFGALEDFDSEEIGSAEIDAEKAFAPSIPTIAPEPVEVIRETEPFEPLNIAASEPQRFAPLDMLDDGFYDEELVVDRYTVATGGAFAGRQAVSSREGREISNGFGATRQPPVEHRVARMHDEPQIENKPKSSSFLWPAEGPAPPAEKHAETSTKSHGVAIMEDEFSTSRPHFDPDDSDMILVEDDVTVQIPFGRASLVKRQEYSRLFATLRKGNSEQ